MVPPSKRSNLALDILSEAQGPEFAATYYRDKIVQRPLYLKPTPKDDETPNDRDLRQRARQAAKVKKRRVPGKPKPLSAKQKRALQIYQIPKDQQKYDIYVPLHNLWCSYIREVLGLDNTDLAHTRHVESKNAGPLLASADYHGALVEVVQCRSVGRVGVTGIIVRDTKSTFEIITKGNKLKIIPKEHTVFRFEIPLATGDTGSDEQESDTLKPIIIELHGSNFEFRAPERATRSMKIREMRPSEINS